jgi:peroxiredoxin
MDEAQGRLQMTRLAPGSTAPGFTLPDLDDRHVVFDPTGPGHKALVFYKSDCAGCQFSLPLFDRLHSRLHGGSEVYAVAQDTPRIAREFAQTRSLTVPQLVDAEPYTVSRAYHLQHVPTLFVIDPEGRIVIASAAFVREQVERAAGLLAAGHGPVSLFDSAEDIPQIKPG